MHLATARASRAAALAKPGWSQELPSYRQGGRRPGGGRCRRRLAEAAHAHGALLVVDATQAAGQCPIDVTGQTSVLVSFRKNFIHFSPHLNNDADDIQKALQALDRIIG